MEQSGTLIQVRALLWPNNWRRVTLWLIPE
jgi:hypothetical protein